MSKPGGEGGFPGVGTSGERARAFGRRAKGGAHVLLLLTQTLTFNFNLKKMF